jgi:hypothetical protein
MWSDPGWNKIQAGKGLSLDKSQLDNLDLLRNGGFFLGILRCVCVG